MENRKNYGELLKEGLKLKYGSKWGLYKHNIERKAQGYIKYAKNELTRDLKVIPEDLKGFVEFGIFSGVSKYSLSSTKYKTANAETRLKLLDLSRTEEMARAYSIKDEGFILPSEANEMYLKGEITREQWLKLLKEFRENSKEYLYTGYGKN